MYTYHAQVSIWYISTMLYIWDVGYVQIQSDLLSSNLPNASDIAIWAGFWQYLFVNGMGCFFKFLNRLEDLFQEHESLSFAKGRSEFL